MNTKNRIALVLFFVTVLVHYSSGSGLAQLADSPWPMRGHDARHTGQSQYRGSQVDSLKWKFETNGSIYWSSPAITSDGTVYVGSCNGFSDNYIYSINPDGSMKWKFRTNGEVSSSPAIASDGSVYVGSDYYLYAINPDGNLKWKFKTGSTVESSSAIGSDGTIYVGSDDKHLYAVNLDGSMKWKFQTEYYVTSSPAIGSDGTIYVGSWDKYLYAINPNGSLKWKFNTGSIVSSSPAIGSDGTIYVGSNNNNLYAINPDGSLKWKLNAGKFSPAIASDGTVYLGSRYYLYAINPDGSLKWEFEIGDWVKSSPAIGSDGTIYVGSDDNHLYAVNPDGSLKWKYKTGGDVNSSPSIGLDGTVYVGSVDNFIYAIQSLMEENISPELSNGTVWPPKGTIGTEFRFTVIYADNNNDAPTKINIKIDNNELHSMSAVNSDDKDYVNGAIFEYKTRLEASTHTYTFAANDWSLNATGDIDTKSGPIVVDSGLPSVLYNGGVIPQAGILETEFTFEVIYANEENKPPSEVIVKIDGNANAMVPEETGNTDYIKGMKYQYKTKLSLGNHTYSFAAKTGILFAIGDITDHSGPFIGEESDNFPIHGIYTGKTSQDTSISFEVPESRTSVINLEMTVSTSVSIEVVINPRTGATQTQHYIQSFDGIFKNLEILDGSISGAYISPFYKNAWVKFSGKFTSSTTVEGTFYAESQKDFIGTGSDGSPQTVLLTLVGSGTWNASCISAIEIIEPQDGLLIKSPTVTIYGYTAGPLVNSAEVNGTPVQLTYGIFSTDVSLSEGANSINLIAFDTDTNIVGTYSVRVTLDSTPPVIILTEPTDNFETPDESITIKGTVDDPSILYVNVNEIPICVIEGKFTTNILLKPGINTISVKASDEAGNSGSDQITVVRKEPTTVEELQIPQVFALHQNFPNPFNASTTVLYQLPESVHIRLTIYNILGQKVITLVDDVQPAGYYIKTWDGRDQSGMDVSGGIYLYCLTGSNRFITKKMLLLR